MIVIEEDIYILDVEKNELWSRQERTPTGTRSNSKFRRMLAAEIIMTVETSAASSIRQPATCHQSITTTI